MSLESEAVVLLRVQVLLSKRLTVVTVSGNESHSLYTGTQVGLAGDTVYYRALIGQSGQPRPLIGCHSGKMLPGVKDNGISGV